MKYRSKKLQQLAVVMGKYSKESWFNIDNCLRDLYKKYNVTSRSEMNIEDIEKEIESYAWWIREFNK